VYFLLQDIVIKFSAPGGTQEANDWVKRIRDVIWNVQRRAEEIKVNKKPHFIYQHYHCLCSTDQRKFDKIMREQISL